MQLWRSTHCPEHDTPRYKIEGEKLYRRSKVVPNSWEHVEGKVVALRDGSIAFTIGDGPTRVTYFLERC